MLRNSRPRARGICAARAKLADPSSVFDPAIDIHPGEA